MFHILTPIFICVDITEDEIKSVTHKILRNYGPVGTDSDSVHGWLLKFGIESKRLCGNVEILFIYFLPTDCA